MQKKIKDSKITSPSASSLAGSMKGISRDSVAPMDKWDPPFCGDIDMRIARDGTWFYLGTPIGRPELVKLFSSIIRKDDNNYFLVTPVEKVGIQVDDAPFIAVDFNKKQNYLEFETNVGDIVVAGKDHPIRVTLDTHSGEPSPYILIRKNLEALIDRKSFYRLVDIGECQNVGENEWFGVSSNDIFFPLIRSSELY
ncbi:MAG: DUF1285 domain-containing protein [Proteobacteria bacterium]|jgi:hypothetical protein|nr:DUF1285 domain-containing protein [Pseudomonadota bacterium]MDA1238516.1 DUF1285 domain-containing protein [Pseudomonadota bacterium]